MGKNKKKDVHDTQVPYICILSNGQQGANPLVSNASFPLVPTGLDLTRLYSMSIVFLYI